MWKSLVLCAGNIFLVSLYLGTHRNPVCGVCVCISILFKAKGQFHFVPVMNSVRDVMVHSVKKMCTRKKKKEKKSSFEHGKGIQLLAFPMQIVAFSLSLFMLLLIFHGRDRRSKIRVKAFLFEIGWKIRA